MEEEKKQGLSEKQLRTLRKKMGIESNKPSFEGGFEMSLPDSDNID